MLVGWFVGRITHSYSTDSHKTWLIARNTPINLSDVLVSTSPFIHSDAALTPDRWFVNSPPMVIHTERSISAFPCVIHTEAGTAAPEEA